MSGAMGSRGRGDDRTARLASALKQEASLRAKPSRRRAQSGCRETHAGTIIVALAVEQRGAAMPAAARKFRGRVVHTGFPQLLIVAEIEDVAIHCYDSLNHYGPRICSCVMAAAVLETVQANTQILGGKLWRVPLQSNHPQTSAAYSHFFHLKNM